MVEKAVVAMAKRCGGGFGGVTMAVLTWRWRCGGKSWWFDDGGGVVAMAVKTWYGCVTKAW